MDFHWDECVQIEKAFYKRFKLIPDVRYHEGNFCLWKKSNMCDGIMYYTLSPIAKYAISFIETVLIQVPSAIAVFENVGAKKEYILYQNQLEMQRLFENKEVYDEV